MFFVENNNFAKVSDLEPGRYSVRLRVNAGLIISVRSGEVRRSGQQTYLVGESVVLPLRNKYGLQSEIIRYKVSSFGGGTRVMSMCRIWL